MHPLLTAVLRQMFARPFPGIDRAAALQLEHLPPSALLDLMAVARLASAETISRTPGESPGTGGAPDASTDSRDAGGGVPASAAHDVTRASQAPAGFACGIISAKTGACSEDCAFCAQSAHHKSAAVHPLVDYDTLAGRAEALAQAGAARFGIVTSGHALTEKEMDRLCEYALRLRREFPLRLCASLGRLRKGQAGRLRQAGFTRYHHNLETSASFYPAICTTHAYEERTATVAQAAREGLETCSGGIFGLGERWEDRVDMAFTLRNLDVDSLPLNFLHPIPGTPLENRHPLPPAEALRCIALFRLIHPRRDIIICGGREYTLGQRQSHIFAAGANALMIGNYLTTAGSGLEADREMLESLGLGHMLGKKTELSGQ